MKIIPIVANMALAVSAAAQTPTPDPPASITYPYWKCTGEVPNKGEACIYVVKLHTACGVVGKQESGPPTNTIQYSVALFADQTHIETSALLNERQVESEDAGKANVEFACNKTGMPTSSPQKKKDGKQPPPMVTLYPAPTQPIPTHDPRCNPALIGGSTQEDQSACLAKVAKEDQAAVKERIASNLAEIASETAATKQKNCLINLHPGDSISKFYDCGGHVDHVNSDVYVDQLVFSNGVIVYIDKSNDTVQNVQWSN